MSYDSWKGTPPDLDDKFEGELDEEVETVRVALRSALADVKYAHRHMAHKAIVKAQRALEAAIRRVG